MKNRSHTSYSSIGWTPLFFLLLSLSSSIFLFSCKEPEKEQPGILPKDKMIDVLVDIHIAEASSESHGLTSIQINQLVAVKYEGVLQKHGITRPQFQTAFDYYLRHPAELDEIYQEVVNRLTALESKLPSTRSAAVRARADSLGIGGIDSLKRGNVTPPQPQQLTDTSVSK